MADKKISIHLNSTYDGKGMKSLNRGIQQTQGAVGKLRQYLGGMGSSLVSAARSVGGNLMNIKAGFDMLKGAVQNVLRFMRDSFDFTSATMQFKFLTGSMDTAREHMSMLQELGRTPPFSWREFAEASRQLMVYSDGALGAKESLNMVGDAAAAVGVPVETMAESVGRFYARLKDGQPVAEAANRLREMGALSPKVAAKLKEMDTAGASTTKIWNEFTSELRKFKGMQDEIANTANGSVEQIKSTFEEMKITVGGALAENMAPAVENFKNKLVKLKEDGDIQVWANKTAEALKKIADGLKPVAELAGNAFLKIVEFGDFTGDLFGSLAGGEGIKSFLNRRIQEGVMDDKIDQETRTEAKKKAQKAKQTEEEAQTAEKNRVKTALERAQAEKDRKQAEADQKYNDAQVQAIKEASYKADEAGRQLRERIDRNNSKLLAQERQGDRDAQTLADEDRRQALLKSIDARLAKIYDRQREQKLYLDAGDNGHSGINNWGEDNRPRDPRTGRFLRPEHQSEFERKVGRGERNIDSQRIGPNRRASELRELNRLEDRIRKSPKGIEGLDQRDRSRLRRLRQQWKPEEDALKAAKDTITKADITSLGDKLDQIKTALNDSLTIQ